MSKPKSLQNRFHLLHPIIQAPMAGGVSTPELAAAVSNAGGMGSLGGGYSSPEKLREEIQKTKALTSKPFAVNLFISEWPARPDDRAYEQMSAIIGVYRKELGLSGFAPLSSEFEIQDEQMQVILDEKPAVFSFTFGIPSASWLQKFKDAGIYTIGTATHLAEAVALEKAGVDAICVQGSEAGGHRGTFIGKIPDSLIGTLALTSQVVSKVSIPVIAAGGIMNGQAINAVLELGAEAAQMGTAFLLTSEAGTNAPFRKILKTDRTLATTITRAFSGREARAIVNRMVTEMKEVEVLPYPYQNALTRELRTAAAKVGEPEMLSLYAGQGASLVREMSVQKLIETLAQEMQGSAGLT
jgi:nitronate monooxygenase